MVNANKLSEKEKQQLELGKKLEAFYQSGYVNKKQSILFSFYKGMAAGFGAFLGGTILIAILIWLLNLFSNPVAENLIKALNSSPK
jgi:hypothetical protein